MDAIRKLVVGAAIVQDGRVLAAQRAEPEALRGGWEFPGGKVEPGESDLDALVRECVEELGVEIVPGERVAGEWPLPNDYVMRVWLASIRRGVPEAREHLALRWLPHHELYDVAWLAPDLPIVAAVEKIVWE
ncbi:(deoxy)nucleoside triphosphate pyrophosphohydrolase [Planotetraspora mira]|jgi:8-oxo-dGTP diphosphatase|uniref:8-oxo-dGTP diphosphatase n=1 Tax=Planotetraspora mira TaxID=58121 RepID=A0A8J3X6D7_9ACTN|nr:(deoxy)nucleoside triphosphate pyrophosphohydrolase [Planotetraspora mira]GII29737.1 DNA mismatch repair protein MutT [Planotetraspora mira]